MGVNSGFWDWGKIGENPALQRIELKCTPIIKLPLMVLAGYWDWIHI